MAMVMVCLTRWLFVQTNYEYNYHVYYASKTVHIQINVTKIDSNKIMSAPIVMAGEAIILICR